MTAQAPTVPVTDERLRSILSGPDEATWWVSAHGVHGGIRYEVPRTPVRFEFEKRSRTATNADRFGWFITQPLVLSVLRIWRSDYGGEPLAADDSLPTVTPRVGEHLWIDAGVVRVPADQLAG